MKSKSEIRVTLSDELFDQLRTQAQRLRVPLKWLVASLVCDTFEPVAQAIPVTASTPGRSFHVV